MPPKPPEFLVEAEKAVSTIHDPELRKIAFQKVLEQGLPGAESSLPEADWFDAVMDYWNAKVRRFTIIDLKLIQVLSMALAIIVVKVIPGILDLSIWWFVAVLVVCLPRPFYVFWCQTGPRPRL
jgi:hypothetical protein